MCQREEVQTNVSWVEEGGQRSWAKYLNATIWKSKATENKKKNLPSDCWSWELMVVIRFYYYFSKDKTAGF